MLVYMKPLFLQEALGYYELVFDAVYTPKITRLLREAEQMGAKTVTGVDMFIGQAYEQYERFTGMPGKFNFCRLFFHLQWHYAISFYLLILICSS